MRRREAQPVDYTPQGELVASQRGRVVHVHYQRRALTMLTDDGHHVVPFGEESDAE